MGSPFCKYLKQNNDLYNGSTILNLPIVVVEIWFVLNIKLSLRFGQEVKVKLGSRFVNIFWQLTICTMVQRKFTSCGCWDMICLNIKLWIIVIRYMMTSSWRHILCSIYLLCSKYMPSFKFRWSLQVCVFL